MPAIRSSSMTKTENSRFDNITERVFKKVLGTFGGTVEAKDEYENELSGAERTQTLEIESRGVIYTVTIEANRKGE